MVIGNLLHSGISAQPAVFERRVSRDHNLILLAIFDNPILLVAASEQAVGNLVRGERCFAQYS